MWSGSAGGGDLPAGADELARDRDGHDAGRLAAAVAQQVPARVEPSLDAPGVVDERRVVAALADGEIAADRRRQPVVQRGFDEQPAGVGGAGLGDLAEPPRVSRAVLGRNQPDVAGDRIRVIEALPVTDLRAQPQRGQGVDPAQAAQPRDRLAPHAALRELRELAAHTVAPREHDVMGVQIVSVGDP
jgi:hypothetical protein